MSHAALEKYTVLRRVIYGCEYWLQPASSQFARFHFVFAINNKSSRGDRYTKDGKFCRLRRNLPPAPTFPANFKQESFSWSRSQTQVGECKKAPRRRLFCLSPLAPPETGSRRVPQGFILSHLCGGFFWPQEQRSILFGGSFTLRMTHYSKI